MLNINSNSSDIQLRLTMTNDWLLRVSDGKNFKRSSRYRIWGIKSTTSANKNFLKNVKPGDRLWFVKHKSQGQIIAVATYRSYNYREVGPLINITMTNEELGWEQDGLESDIEVHYTDLYGLENCELLSHIKGACTIRLYNEKCKVDLPTEYSYIARYSKVTFEL